MHHRRRPFPTIHRNSNTNSYNNHCLLLFPDHEALRWNTPSGWIANLRFQCDGDDFSSALDIQVGQTVGYVFILCCESKQDFTFGSLFDSASRLRKLVEGLGIAIHFGLCQGSRLRQHPQFSLLRLCDDRLQQVHHIWRRCAITLFPNQDKSRCLRISASDCKGQEASSNNERNYSRTVECSLCRSGWTHILQRPCLHLIRHRVRI